MKVGADMKERLESVERSDWKSALAGSSRPCRSPHRGVLVGTGCNGGVCDRDGPRPRTPTEGRGLFHGRGDVTCVRLGLYPVTALTKRG
jgi:hypothetical protein